jgi:hypothetical protein
VTIQPTEYERPTWRQVNIDKLAQRLYAEHWRSQYHDVELILAHRGQPTIDKWTRVAEAAVDLLIDEPEREFEAQLADVLGIGNRSPEVTESTAASEWREATASDWMPERRDAA